MRVTFFGVCVALSVVSAAHAEPERFVLVARGAVLDGALGMSRAGYSIMGDLGGESAGIRSFASRRWLLQWDVLFAARVGELANADRYLTMFGVRGLAWVEPVRRLSQGKWSPVASGRLGADAQDLSNTTSGQLRELNDMSGVGGAFARGLVRVGGGASFLDATRSLILQAFVQERLQSHTLNQDGLAFTQVGLGARIDWTWGLQAWLEATWGVTPNKRLAALRLSDRTTRMGFEGSARKVFSNGMWIGLFVSLERDSDHLVYSETGVAFDTANPANFGLGAAFGVPLWRAR